MMKYHIAHDNKEQGVCALKNTIVKAVCTQIFLLLMLPCVVFGGGQQDDRTLIVYYSRTGKSTVVSVVHD